MLAPLLECYCMFQVKILFVPENSNNTPHYLTDVLFRPSKQFMHLVLFSFIILRKANLFKFFQPIFKAAVADLRYFARSRFTSGIVYKKNVGLI